MVLCLLQETEGQTGVEIESAEHILKSIHADLDDKDAKAKVVDAEMKRRNDEMDRKSGEIELLTRRFNTIIAAQGPVQHTGKLVGASKLLQHAQSAW